jgi:short-subunit dehydrogenase
LSNKKDDRVVLITGGAGGMGRAIAARFLEAGARVAASDLNPQNLEAGVFGIAADVTKVADCERMVKETVAKYGRLDVLVAGAGIWTEGPADEATEAEYDKVMAVNLKGLSAFGGGDAEGYLENLRSKYPQKTKARFITAEEVAELVYMSASPLLGALTGAALAFDFGLSAGT